jgi:hypothetical protein
LHRCRVISWRPLSPRKRRHGNPKIDSHNLRCRQHRGPHWARSSPQGMPADLRVACSREGTHPPRSQSLGVASPRTKKFLATLRADAHLSRNGITVSPSFVRSMKLTRSPNSFRLPYTVTPYSFARGDVAVPPFLCGFDSERASLQALTAQSLPSF